jgi:hypothetical protein
MSSPTPHAMWYIFGFLALAYGSVPLLLRNMRGLYPAMFARLGAPEFTHVFSRYPGHWKVQRRFTWFVLTGRAWRETRGGTRALAGAAWLAYVGFGVSWIMLVFESIKH